MSSLVWGGIEEGGVLGRRVEKLSIEVAQKRQIQTGGMKKICKYVVNKLIKARRLQSAGIYVHIRISNKRVKGWNNDNAVQQNCHRAGR